MSSLLGGGGCPQEGGVLRRGVEGVCPACPGGGGGEGEGGLAPQLWSPA